MGEGLVTSLPLSEEFGNVDKIGVRNRESEIWELITIHEKGLKQHREFKK